MEFFMYSLAVLFVGISMGKIFAMDDARKIGYFDIYGERYSIKNVGKLNKKGQIDRSTDNQGER